MTDTTAGEGVRDYPDNDATDAAHPAWWRGHEHTAAVFCQKVNEILDGMDDGRGVSNEPWETTRRRLLKLTTPKPPSIDWSVVGPKLVEALEAIKAGGSWQGDTASDALAAQPSAGAQGEAIGPDSFSAEGKFWVAVDHLTRMTWRWGESCGIDDVSWDDIGDSYNETCRDDHRKARRALVEAFHAAVAEKAATPAQPDTGDVAALREAIAACKGEQKHFETWAKSRRYDMSEHPLHYIFNDPKTDAARMGWNAALAYVREQFAALSKPNAQGRED